MEIDVRWSGQGATEWPRRHVNIDDFSIGKISDAKRGRSIASA
jgi:hypothetical protein